MWLPDDASRDSEPGAGEDGMRLSCCAHVFVAVLTCTVACQQSIQPSLASGSVARSEQPERQPREQKQERPSPYEDGARVDDGRVQSTATAPVSPEPDRLPKALKQSPAADPAGNATIKQAERSDTKHDLSYLAYYAYSEAPPETKPADTVLDCLKSTPPGTPIDEIRRVSSLLRLDSTFMKTVAKIESGFDPKQRTGSYIGLFQLSKKEFEKYGSGDILNSRDNTVAAAIKFMTEAVMFEMFTHRKPTLNDVYLIHQQGVDGAAEHVSHPHRLAWRSMCATDEGKEKGEKWCKRAIWGNMLPAVKRIWKNVNNVTSGTFATMWQQRLSHFYARYSEATAN